MKKILGIIIAVLFSVQGVVVHAGHNNDELILETATMVSPTDMEVTVEINTRRKYTYHFTLIDSSGEELGEGIDYAAEGNVPFKLTFENTAVNRGDEVKVCMIRRDSTTKSCSTLELVDFSDLPEMVKRDIQVYIVHVKHVDGGMKTFFPKGTLIMRHKTEGGYVGDFTGSHIFKDVAIEDFDSILFKQKTFENMGDIGEVRIFITILGPTNSYTGIDKAMFVNIKRHSTDVYIEKYDIRSDPGSDACGPFPEITKSRTTFDAYFKDADWTKEFKMRLTLEGLEVTDD